MKKDQKLVTIGFDARMVAYRQAGIGQYSLNLLRELALLQDDSFKLVIYQSRKEKRPPADWLFEPGSERHAIAKRVLWTPPHHRYEQLALPVELLPLGPTVWHSPDFIPPFRRWAWRGFLPRRIASVITIHDLAFIRFPHLLTDESRQYYGQVKRAAHSAQRVIAVSQSTAQDAIKELDVAPDKIRVVPEAASSFYHPLSEAALTALGQNEAKGVVSQLAQAGLKSDEPFLLFVSTIEPRKNLPTLLKAYRQLLDNSQDTTESLPRLMIAGKQGWLYEEVYRLAEDLQLAGQLVWLGGVSTEELLYLYNRAAVLTMPSLYEGFGLPPLEALACGCPVLVADTSSLPEVVGTVGQKLPPEDVNAWAKALRLIWQNRVELKQQALLDGPAWASQFSWRRAAQETLAAYREAAELV